METFTQKWIPTIIYREIDHEKCPCNNFHRFNFACFYSMFQLFAIVWTTWSLFSHFRSFLQSFSVISCQFEIFFSVGCPWIVLKMCLLCTYAKIMHTYSPIIQYTNVKIPNHFVHFHKNWVQTNIHVHILLCERTCLFFDTLDLTRLCCYTIWVCSYLSEYLIFIESSNIK